MNAPKKQRPKTEEQAAQLPAGTTAAVAPVNSAPQALAGEPGVTVPGTVESRPDDAPPGEAIVVPSTAQFEAVELAQAAEATGKRIVRTMNRVELAQAAEAPEATAGPAPEAPAALQGNARALRRVEHDGKVYGPGEPAGDVLKLSAAQLASLEPTGAIETL